MWMMASGHTDALRAFVLCLMVISVTGQVCENGGFAVDGMCRCPDTYVGNRCQIPANGTITNSKSGVQSTLSWGYDCQFIYLKIKCSDDGWCGYAFNYASNAKGMAGGDLWITWVENDGTPVALDYWAAGDNTPDPDGTNNLIDVTGFVDQGFSTISFKRALITGEGNQNDHPMYTTSNPDGTYSLSWAQHPFQKAVKKHRTESKSDPGFVTFLGPWITPCPPLNLKFTQSTSSQISMAWEAPVLPPPNQLALGNYELQRNDGTTSLDFTTVYIGTATSHTETGLSPAHVYKWRIRATNALGAGPWSDPPVDVPTASETATAPDAVSGLVVTFVNQTHFQLSWEKPNDNGSPITGYQWQVRPTGHSFFFVNIDGPDTLTYMFSTDEAGNQVYEDTSYRIRIRAMTTLFPSRFSDVFFNTPPYPPCINDCNGNGNCIKGHCHCYEGYLRIDCSVYWGHHLSLRDGQFDVYWNYDHEKIFFQYKAQTLGWMGLITGWEGVGGMVRGDAMIAGVHAGNVSWVEDRWSEENERTPVLDGSQDLYNHTGYDNGNFSLVNFERLLVTPECLSPTAPINPELNLTGPDFLDNCFVFNVTTVSYAFGLTDVFIQHASPAQLGGPGGDREKLFPGINFLAPTGPPTVPLNLGVELREQTSARLVWRAPEYNGSEPVLNYTVQVSNEVDGLDQFTTEAEALIFRFDLSGLTAATVYRFRVRANNVRGVGNFTSFTFRTKDTVGPVVSNCPSDISAFTNGSIPAPGGVAVTWGLPSAVDAHDGPVARPTPVSDPTKLLDIGSIFPVGATFMNYLFSDLDDNIGSCNFTVTVTDDDPPIVSGCPADITLGTHPSNHRNVSVTWIPPTALDNVDGVLPTSAPVTVPAAVGNIFDVGTTSVTYTWHDQAGNNATCVFSVTVVDDDAPIISGCPANIASTTHPSTSNTSEVSWTPPTSLDNVDLVVQGVFSSAPQSGLVPNSRFPMGLTQILYSFTDTAGNTAECRFNITVTDDDHPVVSGCPASQTLGTHPSTGRTAVAAWELPTAVDNVDFFVPLPAAVSQPISGLGNGSTFPLGPTTVSYTFRDASGNNAPACVFTITVVDDDPPVISGCPANVSLFTDSSGVARHSWGKPTAFDNVEGNLAAGTPAVHPASAGSLDSGSNFPFGVTRLTYTFGDTAGNFAQCQFTVTVIDDDAPVIANCPSNINQGTDANIPAPGGARVSWTVPTGTDNVQGPVTPVILSAPVNLTADNVFPLGTTAVRYTFTDNSGNSAFCAFNVTVFDNDSPSIAGCPANIAVGTDASIPRPGGSRILWTVPNATDNVDGFIAAGTPVTFPTTDLDVNSTFPVAETTVTYTFVDSSNNQDTCSFTVTVTDDDPPTITCPDANFTGTVEVDKNGTQMTWTVPSAIDNVDVSVLVPTPVTSPTANLNLDDLFPPGETLVSYTFSDAAGNQATCNLYVIVADEEPPLLSCPPNVQVHTTGTSATVAWSNPIAYDVVDGYLPQSSFVLTPNSYDSSGTTLAVGNHTAEYNATDAAGNSAACTFNLIVVDGTKQYPFIALCPSNIVLPAFNTTNATWELPVAHGAGDVNLTVPTPTTFPVTGLDIGQNFPIGTTTVTYEFTDSSTTRSCVFTVEVKVGIPPPNITDCPADISVPTDTGVSTATVTWTVPSATDALEGTLTTDPPVTVPSGLNTGSAFPIGTSSVQYTWSNQRGQTVACRFTVAVSDQEQPTITNCSSNITVGTDDGKATAVVSFVDGTATDNSGATPTRVTATSPTTGLVSGSAFPFGSTRVTQSFSDAAGNSRSCTFDVTVFDDEAPTLTSCPSSFSRELADDSSTSVAVTWTFPTATDNVDTDIALTQQPSEKSGDSLGKGVFAMTYVFTDDAGFSVTCQFSITVLDTYPPRIQGCDTSDRKVVFGEAATWVVPVFFDSGDSANINPVLTSVPAGKSRGDTLEPGTYSFTYSATDTSGNTATCTFNVISVDEVPPVVSGCPANVSTHTDAGKDIAVVTFALPTATDDFNGDVTSSRAIVTSPSGLTSGSEFPLGLSVLTATFSDAAGNEAACTWTVNVTDQEAPSVASCPSNRRDGTSVNDTYAVITIEPPQALDNVDGSVNFTFTVEKATFPAIANIGVTSTGGFFALGLTNLLYVFTDKAGNSEECRFSVEVPDTTPPVVIGCPSSLSLNTSSSFVNGSAANWTAPHAVDNLDGTLYASDPVYLPARSNAHKAADILPVGKTFVSYTFTDASGNSAICTFEVVVKDVSAPVFQQLCPENITVDWDEDVPISWTEPVVFDAVDGVLKPTIVSSPTAGLVSGSTFTEGTYSFSYSWIDNGNNTAACDFSVTMRLNCPSNCSFPQGGVCTDRANRICTCHDGYLNKDCGTKYQLQYDFNDRFNLKWAYDSEYIYVQVFAKTTGWVGLNFGYLTNGMTKADCWRLWVDSDGAHALDYWSESTTIVPLPDTDVFQSGDEDLMFARGEEVNGTTRVSFMRKLVTADAQKNPPWDRAFTEGFLPTAWAMGETDEWVQHLDEDRGPDFVNWLAPTGPPSKAEVPVLVAAGKEWLLLEWKPVAVNGSGFVQNYTLVYDQGNTNTYFVPVFEGLQYRYNVSGLTLATTYQFKVRANNEVGNGNFSEVLTGITLAFDPVPPATPTVAPESINATVSSIHVAITVPNLFRLNLTVIEILMKGPLDTTLRSVFVGAPSRVLVFDPITNIPTERVTAIVNGLSDDTEYVTAYRVSTLGGTSGLSPNTTLKTAKFSPCPQACFGRGECIQRICKCEPGYLGDICQHVGTIAPLGSSGHYGLSFKVADGYIYGHIVRKPQPGLSEVGWTGLMIQPDPLDGMTGGDCWVFRTIAVAPKETDTTMDPRVALQEARARRLQKSRVPLIEYRRYTKTDARGKREHRVMANPTPFDMVAEDRFAENQVDAPTDSKDANNDLEIISAFKDADTQEVVIAFRRVIDTGDPVGDKVIQQVPVDFSWAAGKSMSFAQHGESLDDRGKAVVNFFTGSIAAIPELTNSQFWPILMGVAGAVALGMWLQTPQGRTSPTGRFLLQKRIHDVRRVRLIDDVTLNFWNSFVDLTYGELLMCIWYIGTIVTYVVTAEKRYQRSQRDFNFVMGQVSAFHMGLTLLPMARNTVWIRVFGISFERAIKYHRWIARLTILYVTIHGAQMLQQFGWPVITQVIKTPSGDGNLFGALTWVCIMPMLLTSFEFIRRRYFEFFYVFHHLYIPAVVLAVKHSDNAFLFMIGPLGLYILDRFHRFTNSNLKATRVISAKIVPLQDDQRGRKIQVTEASRSVIAIEVEVDRFEYGPGDYCFINCPQLSWTQWHPFSISRGPRKMGDSFTFHCMDMGQGTFTHKLNRLAHQQGAKLQLKVDGPYGNLMVDLSYYKVIALNCGGIGVTPFFNILNYLYDKVCNGAYPRLEAVHFVWVNRYPSPLTHWWPEKLLEIQQHDKFHVHLFCTAKRRASTRKETQKDVALDVKESWKLEKFDDRRKMRKQRLKTVQQRYARLARAEFGDVDDDEEETAHPGRVMHVKNSSQLWAEAGKLQKKAFVPLKPLDVGLTWAEKLIRQDMDEEEGELEMETSDDAFEDEVRQGNRRSRMAGTSRLSRRGPRSSMISDDEDDDDDDAADRRKSRRKSRRSASRRSARAHTPKGIASKVSGFFQDMVGKGKKSRKKSRRAKSARHSRAPSKKSVRHARSASRMSKGSRPGHRRTESSASRMSATSTNNMLANTNGTSSMVSMRGKSGRGKRKGKRKVAKGNDDKKKGNDGKKELSRSELEKLRITDRKRRQKAKIHAKGVHASNASLYWSREIVDGRPRYGNLFKDFSYTLGNAPQRMAVFACGPYRMVVSVQAEANAFGYHYHKETFFL